MGRFPATLALLLALGMLTGCSTVQLASGEEANADTWPLVAVFELETDNDEGEGRRTTYLHLAASSWDDWMSVRWPDRPELEGVPVEQRQGRVPALQRFERPAVLSGQLATADATPRTAPLEPEDLHGIYDRAERLLPDDELQREYERDPAMPPLRPHTYVPIHLDAFRANGATVTELDAAAARAAGIDVTAATRHTETDPSYHTIDWQGPGGRELHVALALDPATGLPLHLLETDHDPTTGTVVSELRLLDLRTGAADIARLDLPDTRGGGAGRRPPSAARSTPPRAPRRATHRSDAPSARRAGAG